MQTCTHVHAHMHARTRTHEHAHAQTNAHTHTHKHMHTHTHTHCLYLSLSPNGDIYIVAQPGPALISTWAGHGLLHLNMWSEPDLNQKCDTIIAPIASCVCYSSRPQLCVPDNWWHTTKCKQHSALSLTRTWRSWAECVLHPPQDSHV